MNVRDVSVIEITDMDGNPVSFNSLEGMVDETEVIKLSIDLSKINRGNAKPQISVVDGNHRLVNAFELKRTEQDLEFPRVSFALLVGLSEVQEAILFRDLNGRHKGMDTSHLAELNYGIEGPNILLRYLAGQANWFAHALSEKDQPFEGMIRRHANRKVFREQGLLIPPMTLKSLTSSVQKTLSKSDRLKGLLSAVAEADEADIIKIATAVKTPLVFYWNAVKTNFPIEWQDRKNFILLQSIGLTAFSALAAPVIEKAAAEQKFKQEDFNLMLKHVKQGVDLSKEKWPGVAGPAGAERVYAALYESFTKDMDQTTLIEAWGLPETSQLDS